MAKTLATVGASIVVRSRKTWTNETGQNMTHVKYCECRIVAVDGFSASYDEVRLIAESGRPHWAGEWSASVGGYALSFEADMIYRGNLKFN